MIKKKIVYIYIYIYLTPPHEQEMTQDHFKQSLTSLSFPGLVDIARVKKPSLTKKLPKVGWRIVGFILFIRV